MKLDKVPFVRFLIPLIVGILIEYYLHPEIGWRYLLLALSILTISFSFLSKKKDLYQYRWIFGAGINLLFIIGGIFLTSYQLEKSSYTFESEAKSYRAEIIDIPQQKENTIYLKTYLPDYKKKIVCYISPTILSDSIKVGDEIFFHSKIEEFTSYETYNGFNYAQFMHNNGYAGMTYIPAYRWDFSENKNLNPKIKALQIREQIIDFYNSLDLDESQSAILSALTLGYKNDLTDEITQGFRATGTAHILAISGLHVGIIWGVISSLLFFIRRGKGFIVKQCIIIIALWIYAFIVGLPPSVIRACIMLTLFCIGQMVNRKRVPFNTLSVAGFILLAYNPLLLFDIGFQFSFSSVAFIIWLHPKTQQLIKTKNKVGRKLWSYFSLSLIAQLGTFPIAMYYFGSFPTYFFITNLLIIPLAMALSYLALLLIITHLFSSSFIIIEGIKIVIDTITTIVHFFERIPFAYITDLKINLFELVLIFCIVIGFSSVFIHKRRSYLKLSLAFSLLFIGCLWYNKFTLKDQLSIYYGGDIRLVYQKQDYKLDSIANYKILDLNNTKILFMNHNLWDDHISTEKTTINYLHLSEKEDFSIYSLHQIFNIENVVLDSSIPNRTAKRLAKECQELGISFHDIKQEGTFHLFF